MEAVEALDVLEKITRFWPDKFKLAIDARLAAEWADALGSVSLKEALDAVQKLSRSSKWPPGVYDIREHVAGRRGLLAPDAEQALPMMREWLWYVDQSGYVNGSGYHPPKPQVHKAVRQGAARMGGDWEAGFRFEWPKIKAEYDQKILEGS